MGQPSRNFYALIYILSPHHCSVLRALKPPAGHPPGETTGAMISMSMCPAGFVAIGTLEILDRETDLHTGGQQALYLPAPSVDGCSLEKVH